MKQRSIEWIYNNLKSHFEHDGDLLEAVKMSFEQAKAMHEEEIMDAFQEGKWDGWQNHKLKANNKETQWTDPAQYYNETFNTKEK